VEATATTLPGVGGMDLQRQHPKGWTMQLA
jgi:hypothetical protein